MITPTRGFSLGIVLIFIGLAVAGIVSIANQKNSEEDRPKVLCEIPDIGNVVLIDKDGVRLAIVSSEGKHISESETLKNFSSKYKESLTCFSTSPTELTLSAGFGDGGETSDSYWIMSLPKLTLKKSVSISGSGGGGGSRDSLFDGTSYYLSVTEYGGKGSSVILRSCPIESYNKQYECESTGTIIERYSQGTGVFEYAPDGTYEFVLKTRDSELVRKELSPL